MHTATTQPKKTLCDAGIGHDDLEGRARDLFAAHPFERLTAPQIKAAAPDYAAMSATFPYIQSAATWQSTRDALDRGRPIPGDLAATFPVATFLVSDELGIHWKVMNHGNAALPTILDASGFHSSMLLRDFERIFGEPVDPVPSPLTVAYLRALMDGLSSTDPVRRSAMMASFEVHANRMIGALWCSIAEAYAVDEQRLDYFRIHVGGHDPAEAYHVAMTTTMLSKTVPPPEVPRFYREFDAAYTLHARWCAGLVEVDR